MGKRSIFFIALIWCVATVCKVFKRMKLSKHSNPYTVRYATIAFDVEYNIYVWNAMSKKMCFDVKFTEKTVAFHYQARLSV